MKMKRNKNIASQRQRIILKLLYIKISGIPVLFISFLLAFLLSGSACKKQTIPKPHGYFRIDLPQKNYRLFDSACHYTFEYPFYSKITADTDLNSEPCWINISYPEYNANIHISYKQVNGNLEEMIEDAHVLVYKHTIKADAINEDFYQNEENRVYGILYDIRGDAASSVQFWLTDSTYHYLRGALYFMTEPDEDSLAPVIAFIKEDIVHLIETVNWKK